ncbi:hypothetical protein G6F42_029136 [Rhizopus arrhizus]|nr:hypothetical protein G6F42_029136 [Rhizopus arrhizus]
MINGLSNLSVPANMSNLAVPEFKNLSLNPLNHSVQNGCVLIRSVIHLNLPSCVGSIKAGMDNLADSTFRTVSD